VSALAKRYAKAALEAAQEAKGEGTEGLAKGLGDLARAVAESPTLQEVLRNPVLKDERGKLLDALLGKLQVAGVAAKLVRLLSDNNRIDLLPEVAQQVEALADVRAGRLRAEVRSAVALSEAQAQRLTKALEKRLGQPVLVETSVDPQLLGGLVCQVGDLTFDSSLKRQLAILTERLGAHAL
jgi:F-type H+-transporting ATPase subunit delta